MKPYATIEDVNERRASEITGTHEVARAKALMVDACEKINAAMRGAGIRRPVEGGPQWAACKAVCCSMVSRAMGSDGMEGVKTTQQVAGPYSLSWTSDNPHGDIYLTSAEKRSLGILRGRVGQLRPAIRNGGGDPCPA